MPWGLGLKNWLAIGGILALTSCDVQIKELLNGVPISSFDPSVNPVNNPAPSASPSPTPQPSPGNGAMTGFTTTLLTGELLSPGRGLEIWNSANEAVEYPAAGSGVQSMDHYFRFSWTHFQSKKDVYDWSKFDSQINGAIDKGQKFGFGIMTSCPWCGEWNGALSYDGGNSVYPEYLHDEMRNTSKYPGQAPDWIGESGDWVPNWNHPAFLKYFAELCAAINKHIEEGNHNGVPYKNVINYIDVRGYGGWGEWHAVGIAENISKYPNGTRPTTASLKAIIDAHVDGFPNHQLVALMATFDAEYLGNIWNPPEIAYYALTVKNKRGLLGWRRDNWGARDSYIDATLKDNKRSFNSMVFGPVIAERYKYAPVNGEPMNGGPVVVYNGCEYGDLEAQMRKYGAASFGNGNYQGVQNKACAKTNILAAAKASGYRYIINGGKFTSSVASDRKLTVTLNWWNKGIAPTYEDWDTMIELRNSTGALAWSGKSQHVMRLFLPEANQRPVTDTFVLPQLAPGNYSLFVSVKDPNRYRKPLTLAIDGRQSDGAYYVGVVKLP